MTATSEQSVDALRQESERARAELAGTVSALRDRVGDTATELKTVMSPTHIKQEIRNYVRQERESLIDAVQRKAQENPLQMAAIGAALAYPAFSLLRSVPKPLWLIGAGLFLTGKRGQQLVRDVQTKVDGAVQQTSEKVSELASSVRSDLDDRLTDARETIAGARDAASAKVGSLTEQARAAFHDARDAASAKVGFLADQARAAFHDAHETVAGTVDSASAQAESVAARTAETAGSVKHRAAEMAKSSRNTVVDFVMQNPLLVAGAGAAVGAFIAASIPSSAAENRVFGKGSEKLKDKAREAVAQGIEGASGAIAEAAGVAVSVAAREGLDASGVQERLNQVAGGVRRVANRGLDAALGGAVRQEQTEQPMTERNL